MWLKMGFSMVVESEKFVRRVQLLEWCSCPSACMLCLALSSLQETVTVSAVSLMADLFPGGGVVVCACLG